MSQQEEIEKMTRVLHVSAEKRKLELEEFTEVYEDRERLLPIRAAAEALQDALDAGHGRGTQEYDAAVCGVLDALNAYHQPRRGPDSPTRVKLGRLVRETWVKWAEKQTYAKPSWLDPWEQLDEGQKEVDMLIGEAVAQYCFGSWSKMLHVAHAARSVWKKRCEKPLAGHIGFGSCLFERIRKMGAELAELYPELRGLAPKPKDGPPDDVA